LLVPEDHARIGTWLSRNVLRPTVPLFDEAHRVVHEDPRIRDTAIYRPATMPAEQLWASSARADSPTISPTKPS
jgi:hypothetical protein